jgi:proteasome lid subunit RPN8/RPN11
MQLSNQTLLQIELATRRAYPNEICGYLHHDGTFHEQLNLTEDKTKSIELCPLKFLEQKDAIFAIVHSHTQRSHIHIQTPSLADLLLANEVQLPLYISALDSGNYYTPVKVPPDPSKEYLNRPYIFGVSDCGCLIRDYYLFEFNIHIKIPLTDHLTEKKSWADLIKRVLEANKLQEHNLLQQDNVGEAIKSNNLIDITKTGQLQKGDLLIISILGFKDNHAMIYLGNGLVLNQGEFSKIEPLELYLNKITKVYRYPDLGEQDASYIL